MAETYIIRINDIPSRKIRERVRNFLEDCDVVVVGENGQSLDVVIEKNQLVVLHSK